VGDRVPLAAPLAAAALLLVVASVRSPRVMAEHMIDLNAYQSAVRGFVHGQSIYLHHSGALPFTYPPFAALLLFPLGYASFHAARAAAALASLGGLLIVIVASVRLALPNLAPRLLWTVALAACAAATLLEPVRSTFNYGQINLVILALVLADLSLMDRRAPQGALIGLAAAIKLEPAIFIVYLAATRRLRAALVAIGTLVGATLLSFIVAPHDARLYWTSLVFQTSRVGRPEQEANQSIAGVLARLTRNGPEAHAVWLVLAAVCLCCGIVVAVRLSRRGRELWGICACGLTGLAVSPFSWDHHWVWSAPIAVALVSTAVVKRSTWMFVAGAAWCWLFYAAPIWWVPYKGDAVYHHHGIQVLYSDSFIAAGLIALAVLAAWTLRSPKGEGSAGAAG
jgi:alpha-1,2-mannosyltransferase